MNIIFQIVVPTNKSLGRMSEELSKLIVTHPDVISVAEMEYDGLGGFDPCEELRVRGPRFGEDPDR